MPSQGQLSYLRKLFVFLDDCQQPFEDGEMVSLTDFYRNMYLLGKWKTHFLLQIHQCSKETGIILRFKFGTLFGAGVYCLFTTAAAVVSFPVKENAFVDGDVLVLGVILQIHVVLPTD